MFVLPPTVHAFSPSVSTAFSTKDHGAGLNVKKKCFRLIRNSLIENGVKCQLKRQKPPAEERGLLNPLNV